MENQMKYVGSIKNLPRSDCVSRMDTSAGNDVCNSFTASRNANPHRNSAFCVYKPLGTIEEKADSNRTRKEMLKCVKSNEGQERRAGLTVKTVYETIITDVV